MAVNCQQHQLPIRLAACPTQKSTLRLGCRQLLGKWSVGNTSLLIKSVTRQYNMVLCDVRPGQPEPSPMWLVLCPTEADSRRVVSCPTRKSTVRLGVFAVTEGTVKRQPYRLAERTWDPAAPTTETLSMFPPLYIRKHPVEYRVNFIPTNLFFVNWRSGGMSPGYQVLCLGQSAGGMLCPGQTR
jgi:hypothetical protein